MKKGDLMLARYRNMTENLNKPTTLTQTSGPITFGSKISLLAPHAPGMYYVIGYTNFSTSVYCRHLKEGSLFI